MDPSFEQAHVGLIYSKAQTSVLIEIDGIHVALYATYIRAVYDKLTAGAVVFFSFSSFSFHHFQCP